jgi:hypothetical protein
MHANPHSAASVWRISGVRRVPLGVRWAVFTREA